MKKLIVLSVIFALVAGGLFAVDLGGDVIGSAILFEQDAQKGDDPANTNGGGITRIRIDGSGENDDGTFGGWFRADSGAFYGHVWWKPIDQLKIQLGGNGYDGYFDKGGITGYGFHAQAMEITNLTIASGGSGVWGGDLLGSGTTYRTPFFGGVGDDALYLFITPAEMLGINIYLPILNSNKLADNFKKVIAQLDLNLDFGNIAVTYQGGLGHTGADLEVVEDPLDAFIWGVYKDKGLYVDDGVGGYHKLEDKDFAGFAGSTVYYKNAEESNDPSKIFVSFSLTAVENLGLDVGFAYTMDKEIADKKVKQPLALGLGAKYNFSDAFGLKFRLAAELGQGDDKHTGVLGEIMPVIAVNDSLTAFISVGVGYLKPNKDPKTGKDDAVIGWSFNPYIRIGEEWGTGFYAGVRVWSDGQEAYGKDKKDKGTNFAVPIGIIVKF